MDTKKTIKLLNALADRNRLQILKIINRAGEISCLAITKKTRLSQPTISHHLKVLTDSELINARREGRFGYFSINTRMFDRFINEIIKIKKSKKGGRSWKNG